MSPKLRSSSRAAIKSRKSSWRIRKSVFWNGCGVGISLRTSSRLAQDLQVTVVADRKSQTGGLTVFGVNGYGGSGSRPQTALEETSLFQVTAALSSPCA